MAKRENIRVALVYRSPQHEGKDEFSSFLPVGLFNVLKALLGAGYNASLYNISHFPSHLIGELLKEMEANAILLSAFCGNHHEAFKIADEAKKISSRIAVILGGPFTVLGRAILQMTNSIDYVIRGEGEESAVALLDWHFFGQGNRETVSGLSAKTASGVMENPIKLLPDIDRYFFIHS